MRILLDNNVNRRFSKLLAGHDVTHVQELVWEDLENGDLLDAAESNGYGVLITADKQIRHQQNLKGRRISIVVLNSLRIILEEITQLAPQVLEILQDCPPGLVIVVSPITSL